MRAQAHGSAPAMILAAGLGRRMAPLTDHIPKPLLEVGGQAMIDHHLHALVASGCTRIIVNTAHLGHLIRAHLAEIAAQLPAGVTLLALDEGPTPLETGGGIANALGELAADEFLVINADVFTTFDFRTLFDAPLGHAFDAHLVLVPNPAHHPQGDFCLNASGHAMRANGAASSLTYAGIARLHRRLFESAPAPETGFKLAPMLFEAAEAHRVLGTRFSGDWIDVGTPERLTLANARAAEPRARILRPGGSDP